MSHLHPFALLSQDLVMDAVEALGRTCDGRVFPLNSYENRVYQVGIEGEAPLIAKFYRPERWSEAQIREEHAFCFELEEHELPVVAPWRNGDGESVFVHGDFRFALYPRKGGHAPDLDNLDNLLVLGRCLGRIHAIGASRPFLHRPAITCAEFGHNSVALIREGFIPADLHAAYTSLCRDILALLDERLEAYGDWQAIRVHGDCHVGNILWRDGAPHFVDFDDARMAPAVQDVWMLLSGDRQQQGLQLAEIVDGYNEFFDFDPRQLQLVEVLRTLRIMNYAAWLARRWTDPAFPRAFPWFNSVRYWSEHILELREQFAALQEPPLRLF